jgi:hypothetical protein
MDAFLRKLHCNRVTTLPAASAPSASLAPPRIIHPAAFPAVPHRTRASADFVAARRLGCCKISWPQLQRQIGCAAAPSPAARRCAADEEHVAATPALGRPLL